VKSWLLNLLLGLNILSTIALLLSYSSGIIPPSQFSFIALFGLAYPVILLVQVFFLLLWIILRSPHLLWSLLSIILGINMIFNHLQFNSSNKPIDTRHTQISLLSYNVKLFGLYDSNKHRNRKDLIHFLDNFNADVMCFQEFYHRDVKGFFNTKDTIKSHLNYPYVYESYTHHIKGKQHFGLATFSRFPIINQGKINFNNDPNNSCLYTDIVANQDTIRIYNAHVASKREVQSTEILKHAKNSPYPTILCGDFNDTPASYMYHQMQKVFLDAFKQSGSGLSGPYIGALPNLRIDYIFHSKQLHSYEYKKHSVKLSDHHPISCLLEVTQ